MNVNCKICNKGIRIEPYKYKYQNNFYCSRKCYHNSSKIILKKECFICGKDIIYTPSQLKNIKGGKYFCSRECNGIYLSKQLKRKCAECNSEFWCKESVVGKGDGKFCSLKCKYKNQSGANSHFWKDGSALSPYGKGWNETLKTRIRIRDAYKCQICGVPQEECFNALSVHHIDYDKNNNDMVNLITLCKSCHTKTNLNREHWSNHFTRKV